ncbi:methyltransferase [Alcaligenes parafaecalis]|uniref:Methyltransferase domain-containing protein n=1 Tax=Alcaligenes parafaecalis TaxID=171260 RepID=A0ABT3VM74_9BURK|nr:methyltransferase domain-containing protein [Alcaligenes parafaecalis]MCX5464221.1 methyltransferase domain-containing protein [Alcaligenes parafaecalis]
MSKSINSQDYWNNRFADDWEQNSGPAQSRFFANVTLDNLPSWLIRAVKKQELTLVDWGCAQGDGTDALVRFFDPKSLTGVDFSTESIAAAKKRYGAIDFLAEDWLQESFSELGKEYDFVFSSNTLEHFHDPFEVIKKISSKAKLGLIFALPYREYDRIDEHFFTFTKDNLPTRIGRFSLFWSKVVDCSLIKNTMWAGDQVILVYADSAWAFNHSEFLGDMHIDSGVVNEPLAGYDSLSWHREYEFSKILKHSLAKISTELDNIKDGLSQQKKNNKFLRDQVSELKGSIRQKEDLINMLKNSTSWRITKPLRMAGDFSKKIRLTDFSHCLLKNVYKVLPESIKKRLHGLKAKYLNKRYSSFVDNQEGVSLLDAPEWLLVANGCEKLAVVPCGFEFDELVNQRPINFAKCFSQKGIKTLFVSWQWSPDEQQEKADSEVYPNVWQVPLYDFIKYLPLLNGDRQESIYLATLPAEILVDPMYLLRSKGFNVIYDVMDNWEEFFNAGQAPWYTAEAEELAVLSADGVTVVAPALREKFLHLRKDIEVVGNGFSSTVIGENNAMISLGKSESGGEKVIGYVGHLTDAWFEWDLLFSLATQFPTYRFEIIGYGEPDWVVGKLHQFENVSLIGKVLPKDLHRYVKNWNMALIPFKDGALAQSVDPIKIYEYLYFGLPVLVTGIEHLKSYPYTEVADKYNAAEKLEKLLSLNVDYSCIQIFLADCTWDKRFEQILDTVSRKPAMSVLYA